MFFKTWNSTTAQYSDIETLPPGTELRLIIGNGRICSHYISNSTIGRFIEYDRIQKIQGKTTLGDGAIQFYKEWVTKLDYLNTTMRSIRKVQNDCALIDIVSKDESILNNTQQGYVFDKMDRSGIWQYTVYIPSIKLVSKITTCTNMENYEKHNFNVHLFQDEECVKRKVRLSLASN